MDAGIKKIIELIKKTGDRFVVLDGENQTPYVILPFGDYERIVGRQSSTSVAALSEGELLERINHDIALWREQQAEEDVAMPMAKSWEKANEEWPVAAEETVEDWADVANEEKAVEKSKTPEIEEEKYYFEPIEQ